MGEIQPLLWYQNEQINTWGKLYQKSQCQARMPVLMVTVVVIWDSCNHTGLHFNLNIDSSLSAYCTVKTPNKLFLLPRVLALLPGRCIHDFCFQKWAPFNRQPTLTNTARVCRLKPFNPIRTKSWVFYAAWTWGSPLQELPYLFY